MTTEEQQIQNQISRIWKKVNTFLKRSGNSLLLFDFTSVTHHKSGIKIKSIYQYKIKDYPFQLDEYFSKYGYSIPTTASNDEPVLYNAGNSSNLRLLKSPIQKIYDPQVVTDKKIVRLKTWHRFVKNKKIAGQCWTLFRDFINDVNAKERIEVGVYILLKNSFPIEKIEKDKIRDFISFEVYKFLYNEGRNYFSQEYKEKIKEIEGFKTKVKSNSVIHSLKTELETSLMPLRDEILKLSEKYSFIPDEVLKIKLLDSSINQFYTLSSLSNLIDKIDEKEKMVASGRKDKLFTDEKEQLNINECLRKYKSLNPLSKLYLDASKDVQLEIGIYNIWLGKELLLTFLNMIFQNADEHGKPEEDDNTKITLKINKMDNELEFANKTWYETTEINSDKLTGNLYLFHELLNKSQQMNMSIDSDNYEFKVKLSWIK